MIKIVFEVSEDFVRENANPELATAKAKAEPDRAMKAVFDMLAFSQLNKHIVQGKTEFTVTTDKLDDKSMELFNNEIGEICMLAAFSESDKKTEKKESN